MRPAIRPARLFGTAGSFQFLLMTAAWIHAAVSVTHFGDHMVLQRNIPVPVWGTAGPGEKVTVRFQGQVKTVTAGTDGKWMARLDPMPSGIPSDLILQGANTLTLRDVVVGEVWLAGGQSNMAMGLGIADSSGENIRTADLPLLRFNNARNTKGWSVCSPANAATLSAVAFYFGRELQKKLGIPIGMVVRAASGSRVEEWMDPAAAAADPVLNQDTLFSRLYRSHIAPTMPMAIRGALWYQGESNEQTPETYRSRLPAMIRQWRKNWGQGDFPFYIVQLPLKNNLQSSPQGDGTWPEIREIQRLALALPRTGLAVALDAGAVGTVHPLNKYPVGYRLSLIARALDYGEPGLAYSGPLYESMAIRGSQIRLRFRHAGGGLVAKGSSTGAGGPLAGFSIAGAEGRWHWGDARIHGDTVVVSNAQVPAPTQVRYAWSQNPLFSLYNAEGLPASPFRTEGPQLPVAAPRWPVARPASIHPKKEAPPSVVQDALGRTGETIRFRFHLRQEGE